VELDKPIITAAFVFNAEQIKGMPPLNEYLEKNRSEQTWEPIERAEKLVAASKAHIDHGGNEAYYNVTKDKIQLPEMEQFDTAANYYATLLHEIGHWTGHDSRLDRELKNDFGTEKYAKEELRAEIASLMLGSEMQIGHEFGKHAAYVDNWIKILKDDPYELFKASADAQKIFDFMLKLGPKRDIKEDIKLHKDDLINYNGTGYKVLEENKKSVKIEDQTTFQKTNVKETDKLYGKLVDARNNPQVLEMAEILDEGVKQKIGR
jgi:antirestriction protein ArdC